ncbi:MAG: hypothetical protein RSB63_01005, partial [Enterococcus sp.]
NNYSTGDNTYDSSTTTDNGYQDYNDPTTQNDQGYTNDQGYGGATDQNADTTNQQNNTYDAYGQPAAGY